MSTDEETIAQTLHIARSVSVYTIPPRGPSGYHSGEWKVGDKIHEGRLRILSRGEVCEICIDDPSGELFAMCPVPYGMRNACVEQAVDSSRYFVLRVEDPGTKRHAFLGFGFNERSDSFDFTESLLRHEKNIERERAVKSMQAGDLRNASSSQPVYGHPTGKHAGEKLASQEVQALYTRQGDLALHDGQTIRLQLKKANGSEQPGAGAPQVTHRSPIKLMPLAPPPPPSTSGLHMPQPLQESPQLGSSIAALPATSSASQSFDPFASLATPAPSQPAHTAGTSPAFPSVSAVGPTPVMATTDFDPFSAIAPPTDQGPTAAAFSQPATAGQNDWVTFE